MSVIDLKLYSIVNGISSLVTPNSFMPINVSVGNTLSLSAIATGGNGSGLVYKWTDNHVDVANTQQIQISTGSVQTHKIKVTVSNANQYGSSSSCKLVIDIIPGNNLIGVVMTVQIDTFTYPVVLNGTTQYVNRNDAITLNPIAYGGNGSGYSYQWKINGVNSSTDANINVVTGATGIYAYELIVKNGDNNGVAQTFIITFNVEFITQLNMYLDAIANGIDKPNLIGNTTFTVNQYDIVALFANANNGNGSGVVYEWQIDGTVIQNTASTLVINTNSGGSRIYQTTIKNANGLGATVIIPITVQITPQPAINLAVELCANKCCAVIDCGSTKSVCKNSCVTMSAKVGGGNGSGFLYKWSVDGSTDGPESQTISTSTNCEGKYCYAVLVTNANGIGPGTVCEFVLCVESKKCNIESAIRICGKGIDAVLKCGDCADVAPCSKYELEAILCGGMAPYNYTWFRNGCKISDCKKICVNSEGKYTLKVCDSCSNKTSTTVTINFCDGYDGDSSEECDPCKKPKEYDPCKKPKKCDPCDKSDSYEECEQCCEQSNPCDKCRRSKHNSNRRNPHQNTRQYPRRYRG